MTEDEWAASDDAALMLRFVQSRAGVRKLRLFACACARLLWDHMPAAVCREAVEAAERYADGLAADEERQAFIPRLYGLPVEYGRETGRNWFTDQTPEARAAYFGSITSAASSALLQSMPDRLSWAENARLTGGRQPGLLRCVFGIPHRPSTMDPAWLTAEVVGLAREVYEGRDFDRLPALVDALSAAGCDDARILGHLRGDGPHVRGCWVVDRLLGNG